MTTEEAFRRTGIVGHKIERGQIYLIKDEHVNLPKSRLEGQQRQMHEFRPVLVLQSDADNQDVTYVLALFAPLSSKVQYQDIRDFRLYKSQGGLNSDSLVHLGLVQPILKVDLLHYQGKLDILTMQQIDAVLVANLGLIHRPQTQ